MLNVNGKTRVIAILLVVIMAVSCISVSFASGTTDTTGNPPGNSQGKPPAPKANLDSLVSAGTITQEQANAVQTAIDAGRESKTTMKDTLESLVKAGTITTTQLEAILKSFQPPNGGPGNPPGNPPSGTGNPPSGTGNTTSTVTGTATYLQNGGTETKSNQTIIASDANKSGVKVTNSGSLTLTDSKVTKTGDTSSEDSSNFYGLNAGVLAESSSKINLKNCTIATAGDGANGVFATGSGSSVTLSNVTIKTTADSSRGLDATMTGTIIAKDVDITTEGTHCAAIATDRGNGTVTVTGGTMTTNGVDSPGIYSTGNITVTGAKIKATGSEAAVVEGKNSITLVNTDISGTKKRGVMLYQSFSGDAEVGTSSFKMTGGTLNAKVGPLFYATNTDTVIELNGADVTAESGTLLAASADNWGTKGSNGATVAFTANNEELVGDIICDSISTITATLKNTTTLSGSINSDKTAKAVTLKLDKTSKWSVTGTSYLTGLTDADTTLSNIDDNGCTIYYDSTASTNSWLGGKTYKLTDGGKLTPM